MNINFRETNFNVDEFEHCGADRDQKTVTLKLFNKEPIIMSFDDGEELDNAFKQLNELIYLGFRQHLDTKATQN